MLHILFKIDHEHKFGCDSYLNLLSEAISLVVSDNNEATVDRWIVAIMTLFVSCNCCSIHFCFFNSLVQYVLIISFQITGYLLPAYVNTCAQYDCFLVLLLLTVTS